MDDLKLIVLSSGRAFTDRQALGVWWIQKRLTVRMWSVESYETPFPHSLHLHTLTFK